MLRLAGFRSGDDVDVWTEKTIRDDSVNINYRLDYVLRRSDSEDPPIIVEVMTASTSGGNRKKGTDIQSAFCKAVLYANGLVPDRPASPGVNVRQVWARMASQLVVKSEIANAWGGRTIWVVQDALIDYIRRNTGLPIDRLRSSDWIPDEVNVVTGSIDDPHDVRFYTGPVRGSGEGPYWTELLSSPGIPPVKVLVNKLTKRSRLATITV